MDKKIRKDLEESIKDLRGNSDLFDMMHTETSQSLFTRYQALIKAGFTENQALEIIKARGLSV
jgi:hypothetical protein